MTEAHTPDHTDLPEVSTAGSTMTVEKDEVVEASAGGGMVKAKMSGDLRLLELSIDPEAIDPEDAELLQDMVLAAVNEAIRSARSLQESKLGGLAGGALGGLGLPGLGQ